MRTNITYPGMAKKIDDAFDPKLLSRLATYRVQESSIGALHDVDPEFLEWYSNLLHRILTVSNEQRP